MADKEKVTLSLEDKANIESGLFAWIGPVCMKVGDPK